MVQSLLDIPDRALLAAPDFADFLRAYNRRRHRSMLDFARDCFILPDGPSKGERFDPLPFQRLFFAALDGGEFSGYAITGPAQATKSTIGFVIPTLYYLFELGETIAIGLPDLKMADDKWRMDILPAIKSSNFAGMLPASGPGSRDGKIESTIKFQNGAVLKFMGGGGGDEARSGFTARRVLITEVDKLDEIGGASREADKIKQMQARTQAYGDKGFCGLESTVSQSWGRIWREYQAGTCSSIFCPCPHCREWVSPDRDSLVGWKDAESEGEVRERAAWCCPACGEIFSETQRREMNAAGVLVHKGQKVEWADGVQRRLSGDGRGVLEAGIGMERRENDASRGSEGIVGGTAGRGGHSHDRRSGANIEDLVCTEACNIQRGGVCNSRPQAVCDSYVIHGQEAKTRTLSLRYNAFNVTFPEWTAAFVATKEWEAAREEDEENGQRAVKQFVWALPHDPPGLDVDKLDWRAITRRQRTTARGVCPADTQCLIVTADPGKRLIHWNAVAFGTDSVATVVDYGRVEIASDELGEERALLIGLRDLRDLLAGRFKLETGAAINPTAAIVDSGNWDVVVHAFVAESPGWNASKGFGGTMYKTPKAAPYGNHCHIAILPNKNARLIEFDTDHWKDRAHESLTLPARTPGAVALFSEDPKEHTAYAKHCVAEELKQVFRGGREVRAWDNSAKRANHYWDCLTLALLGGHLAGNVRPQRAKPEPGAMRPEPDAARRGRSSLVRRGPIRRNY